MKLNLKRTCKKAKKLITNFIFDSYKTKVKVFMGDFIYEPGEVGIYNFTYSINFEDTCTHKVDTYKYKGFIYNDEKIKYFYLVIYTRLIIDLCKNSSIENTYDKENLVYPLNCIELIK